MNMGEWEELKKLAQTDLTAFDHRRKEIIEAFISERPEEERVFLYALQEKVESVLEKTPSEQRLLVLSRMFLVEIASLSHAIKAVLHHANNITEGSRA